MVKDALYGFREVKTKELYIIHLSWLKKIVNMAINNHTAFSIELIHCIKAVSERPLGLKPFIGSPSTNMTKNSFVYGSIKENNGYIEG